MAARLPKTEREAWAEAFHGPRLTGIAFIRERERVESRRAPAPIADPEWVSDKHWADYLG